MKVLHVHAALYLPVLYVRELRKRGIEADSLYFGGEEDRWIGGEPDIRMPPASPRRPWTVARLAAFILKKASRYDVVHFHSQPDFSSYGAMFAVSRALGMPALRYLRSAGVGVVYSHWGCHDGRLPSTFARDGQGDACRHCKTGIMGSTCSDDHTATTGKIQERYGDFILNHEPDFSDFNRRAEYHPAIVDHDMYRPGLPIPEKYRIEKEPESLYVYHSAGKGKDRGNERGGDVIAEVIEAMRRDGHKIQLVTTGGRVPYQDVRFYQQQADIAIDHLYYGWYGNAVRECMAQGVPAAAHLSPEWVDTHLRFFGLAPPLIEVNERNLRDVLEHVASHRDELKETGLRQREYIRDIHSTERVIDRLVAVYETAASARRGGGG